MNRLFMRALFVVVAASTLLGGLARSRAEGEWEVTPQSEEALNQGLQWLAKNQGAEGNWGSNDLGLVSMGALAFLSAGHLPGHGEYGEACAKAIDYVARKAKADGLLNIADPQRDMYNHGLSAFVLGQAYGMSNEGRIGPVLDRALKLIVQTQCADGGWDYRAKPQAKGHDLSLVVMQAKALRSAVDSGFEVPPEAIEMAIGSVRRYYQPKGCSANAPDEEQQKCEGQFCYGQNGSQPSTAMAAAGVVCLQEFAQYSDWRIEKNMQLIAKEVREKAKPKQQKAPFDAYTLYYVGQAVYQVGGKEWQELYPLLRDSLVDSQDRDGKPENFGKWAAGDRVGGKPGELYMTAVSCFILAMPNRYLPILQEGKIESIEKQFHAKP